MKTVKHANRFHCLHLEESCDAQCPTCEQSEEGSKPSPQSDDERIRHSHMNDNSAHDEFDSESEILTDMAKALSTHKLVADQTGEEGNLDYKCIEELLNRYDKLIKK